MAMQKTIRKRRSNFERTGYAQSVGERTIKAIVFPILLLWSFTLVYPFIWAIINSFKTVPEFYDNSFALPETWLWSNWSDAFTVLKVKKSGWGEYATLMEMTINSVWYTFGGTTIFLTSVSMLSYTIARYQNAYTRFLYRLTLVVLMLPIMGSLPASYKLVHDLHLDNTPLYLIKSIGGLGTADLLILYSFFIGIPWSYAEAAFMDGAGHWTVFFRIMLPQSVPILTAMFITAAINSWNDFMTPLLYLGQYPTLATGLYIIEHSSLTSSNKPVYFAAMLMSIAPVIAVFVAFNDTIMTSVSIGGLKG